MKKDHFKKVAISAALKAGSFIRDNIGKAGRVHYKGEINVVTEIDKKAERIIVDTIRKKYPGHDFLAEEKTYKKKGAGFTWIIDPLDGTTNFLHGFPVFCVSIALEHKGKIITGVVYDPMRKELFCAGIGKGSFLNNKRIRVSKVREMKKSLLATGFAYNVKKVRNNNINNFTRFIKESQAVRRPGSAALDLSYVACGRLDGFWELCLSPWDTAAAALILSEAGGSLTRFDGSEFTIYDKEILASNSRIHSQMIKVLSK